MEGLSDLQRVFLSHNKIQTPDALAPLHGLAVEDATFDGNPVATSASYRELLVSQLPALVQVASKCPAFDCWEG